MVRFRPVPEHAREPSGGQAGAKPLRGSGRSRPPVTNLYGKDRLLGLGTCLAFYGLIHNRIEG